MCFSASASFISSIALFLISSLTIKKIKRESQKMLAYIPLLFAIQQFSEGLVWLTYETEWKTVFSVAVYSFLFFAFVIWPAWIPTALMDVERLHEKKNMLWYLCIIGYIISVYFLYMLLSNNISAKILHNHIYYHIPVTQYFFELVALYLIPTVLPFFISSLPRIKILGVSLAISCFISYYYWTFFFTSIWCFFAAILSLFIYTFI